MDQFVLFGDSITRQTAVAREFVFFAALSDAYSGKFDIINRGFSGYNTTKALHVLPKVLSRPEQVRISFLTICLGANDARHPGLPAGPEQHVPLARFTENLRAIVEHSSIHAHSDIRIILITPPPVDDRMCHANDTATSPELGDRLLRSATTTAKYAQAVREVALGLNIALLDLWSAMLRRAGYHGHESKAVPGDINGPENEELQSMLRDGLHLNANGYRILFDELMDLIEKKWPELTPEQATRLVPEWDDTRRWTAMFDGEGGAVLR